MIMSSWRRAKQRLTTRDPILIISLTMGHHNYQKRKNGGLRKQPKKLR
jgi:hypothetical protein